MLSPRGPLSLPSTPSQNPAPWCCPGPGEGLGVESGPGVSKEPAKDSQKMLGHLSTKAGAGTRLGGTEGGGLGKGRKGCRGQGVQGPYQAPGFVVVQVNKSSDVIFAFLVLGIHELLGFLVAKLHIIPTAPPLPGGALCARPRRGRGGRPAPCQLAATLQQLAHAAGLRDGVAHSSRRDGVHEGCFTDICRRTREQTGPGCGVSSSKQSTTPWLTSMGLPRSPSSCARCCSLGNAPTLERAAWSRRCLLQADLKILGDGQALPVFLHSAVERQQVSHLLLQVWVLPHSKEGSSESRGWSQMTTWYPQLPHTTLQYPCKQ